MCLRALHTICPWGNRPLLFGKVGLAAKGRMKAFPFLDMLLLETDSEDIIEISVGQPTIGYVLLEDIVQNWVVDIAYYCMERFPANTIRTIISMDGVGVKVRVTAPAIIYWIFQKTVAGNESPCKQTPFIIP